MQILGRIFRDLHPTNQSANQPTNQPRNQATHQPTSHATNQPSNQPTKQLTNQATKHPTNQTANQPSNQSANQPTNLASNQASKQTDTIAWLIDCLSVWLHAGVGGMRVAIEYIVPPVYTRPNPLYNNPLNQINHA